VAVTSIADDDAPASPTVSDLYSAIGEDSASSDTIDRIVAGLVAAGDRSPMPDLTRRLQTEKNPDTLYRICLALGDFHDPYPVPVLIALAQHNDVRDAAFTGHVIWALDTIGDIRARDPLCGVMCHASDGGTRHAAQEALFHNGSWFGNAHGCECEKPNTVPSQNQAGERSHGPQHAAAPQGPAAAPAPTAKQQPAPRRK